MCRRCEMLRSELCPPPGHCHHPCGLSPAWLCPDTPSRRQRGLACVPTCGRMGLLLVPALQTRDQSAEMHKSVQEGSAVAHQGLGACSSPSATASEGKVKPSHLLPPGPLSALPLPPNPIFLHRPPAQLCPLHCCLLRPCPPSPALLSLGNVTLLSRLFTDKILLQACGRDFCCFFLK